MATPAFLIRTYVIILLVITLLEEGLLFLNLTYTKGRGKTLPPFFEGRISPDLFFRSIRYTLDRGRLAAVSELAEKLLLLGIAWFGLCRPLSTLMHHLFPGNILPGLALLGALGLLAETVSLPFTLIRQFRIEAAYGFNRMTIKNFLTDLLKGLILSLLLGAPLLALLLLFIEHTGPWWWIIGLGVTAAFQTILMLLYPLVIAPLFNRFRPLEEGELRDRLTALAQKADFPLQGIYVMDGSRRSNHSNAYFTGFGRSRRIVLYDTLIEQLTPEELEGVLAHEIGHWKKKHILGHYLRALLFLAAGFCFLNQMISWEALYSAFGLVPGETSGILVIGLFFLPPLGFLLTPLFSGITRRQEYQADSYAAALTGTPDPLKEALMKLSRGNLSNLIPHPLYSFFYYSHPTVAERIKHLEKES